MDLDGIAGRGGRLPAEIQSGEAAQPTGLREPGDFCGAELSIPSSGRAAPSLHWGWTKNKQKHNLNHVPRLTHGLDQKSEPGHTFSIGWCNNMKPMKIRLFIKPYCGWCHKAMRWLDERGVKYETLDVISDSRAYTEMVNLSGQTLAPVIDVDGEILADFGPEELAKFWEKLERK